MFSAVIVCGSGWRGGGEEWLAGKWVGGGLWESGSGSGGEVM